MVRPLGNNVRFFVESHGTPPQGPICISAGYNEFRQASSNARLNTGVPNKLTFAVDVPNIGLSETVTFGAIDN